MSSDDCKEALVNIVRDTKTKDWKRTSKKTINGLTVREFRNTATGEVAMVSGEGYDVYELGPNSPMLYYYADAHEMEPDMSEPGETFVMLAPKQFWERNHCIPDWHMTEFLVKVLNVPPNLLDEISENQFIVYAPLDELIETFDRLGFVHEPEMARAGSW